MIGKKKYNILVLGNNGMLGYELYDYLLKLSSQENSMIGTVIGLDVKDGIDVTQRNALGTFLLDSIHFDYCVNCIAYTNTNAAQNTKEGRELDYKLNALAPKYIAKSCKRFKTKLIHISTDYVFSEKSASYCGSENNSLLLFKKDSETFPCNVYGYDKLLGEMYIKEEFGKDSKDYCICRTSWLYGNHNKKSFIHKFLNNAIKAAMSGKNSCTMTSNEVSIPTSCEYVIEAVLCVIKNKISGIFHAVPTSSECGVSRLQFAEEILKHLDGVIINGIDISKINLEGVECDSYWPKYSAMSTSASYSMSWIDMLERFMSKYGNEIIEDLKSSLQIK